MTKAELIEKIAKDADIPKTTEKRHLIPLWMASRKGSKKGTARSPWWDLGPFETFIVKLGWAVIPRPVKRSRLRGKA